MTAHPYKPSSLCRRAAYDRATRAAGLPHYLSDLKPVRGRCLKRGCRSRWGVVRVSLDFRDPARIDRIATLECAACGHVWRRVREPGLVSAAGYQAVRLTLILPAAMRRWFARGRWHAQGSDAVVLTEADLGDLDEAARAHRAKRDQLDARKAKARARAEAEALATHDRTLVTLARLAELDAARAAEEQEAANRES